VSTGKDVTDETEVNVPYFSSVSSVSFLAFFNISSTESSKKMRISSLSMETMKETAKRRKKLYIFKNSKQRSTKKMLKC
jgi:hypothetical protein